MIWLRNSLMIFTLLISLSISEGCKETNTPVPTPTKVEVSPVVETVVAIKSTKKKILFFGDSLTAGYGLDEEESFPSLVQNRIDSLAYDYMVVNAGLSGETSAGGKGRIDWVLREPVDVFVLELGANDMLRGLELTSTKENLRAILDVVKSKSPEATLIMVGMQAPPNMGAQYVKDFKSIFSSIAEEYGADMIPFLLDGVAGIASLNLADGKHPNAIGQKIVLENVWKVLSKHL